MFTKRSRCSAVASGDTLYVTGRVCSDTKTGKLKRCSITEKYVLGSKMWTQVPDTNYVSSSITSKVQLMAMPMYFNTSHMDIA